MFHIRTGHTVRVHLIEQKETPSEMTEHKTSEEPKEKNFFEKLSEKWFHGDAPETKKDLLEDLHEAHDRKLLTDDGMQMMEGVMRVNSLRAEDLMVPRTQMIVIDISEDSEEWIKQVINAGHSRFPVVDGDKDNVVGILLAKDLLRLFLNPQYQIRDHLRQPVYVPESKPADVLLKEFRLKRNHMALVVDEFGSISGLITIEDVLEEIVGEIDDEYDVVNNASDIVATGANRWRVKAATRIDEFNRVFGTHFSDDRYESVGGLVSDELEHVPQVGESVELSGLRFIVTKAVARQVKMLTVERTETLQPASQEEMPKDK